MHTLELVYSCLLAMIILKVFAISQALPTDDTDTHNDSSAVDDGPHKVIYDQRQTGKYNIHVSIKDVAIIEVDQNEIEEDNFDENDYYYDESDLTIKPMKFTSTTAASISSPTKAKVITTTTTMSSSTSTMSSSKPLPITTQLPLTTQIPTSNMNILIATTQAPIAQTTTAPATTIAAVTTTASSFEFYQHPLNQSLGRISKIAIKARTKDIPILAVNDPQAKQVPSLIGNSRIFNLRVKHPNQQQQQQRDQRNTRCRTHQYRDASGNCRSKRSSASILRKLFGMLVSLPFVSARVMQQSQQQQQLMQQ